MNRARIVCVLLSAVACMMVVSPSPALADHPAPASDLVQIREDGVKKVRQDAAHSIQDLNHKGDDSVKKLSKGAGKPHGPKDADKEAKEVAKCIDELNKLCAHGVQQVTKDRDDAIKKLTDRGGPQRFKGRVWRVAQRRMNAIIRFTNDNIARVNAAAA